MLQALVADGVTYQDYVDLIENLNLEYILAANGVEVPAAEEASAESSATEEASAEFAEPFKSISPLPNKISSHLLIFLSSSCIEILKNLL